jgi:hypothetical protein
VRRYAIPLTGRDLRLRWHDLGFQPKRAECNSKKKEKNKMSYAKPEVVALSEAMRAIQSDTVKKCIHLDRDEVHHNATSSAYEADE